MVNLDPAVKEVPYPANIDIRDSVNYKEVMKQYKLGPNGGIVTSLNLFATRFDQVMSFLDKKHSSDFKLVSLYLKRHHVLFPQRKQGLEFRMSS